ncbi:hypothetical protein GCM10010495_46740 [Kitasatospora herbaricolor]|uniref:hypothetical protein n=1 Tax=Kitasatospora herbaricolor TaxID=68217 RepID=UPI001749F010|nr:hypothetical protein [Kitasatospora herbaricolor]MDQ0307862.1 hypothetical protein [Kitasatospora herbaricolor]GGV25637.1 hypothetical protein GCM10010495_46740 [Kitasatospora herbaricolor]
MNGNGETRCRNGHPIPGDPTGPTFCTVCGAAVLTTCPAGHVVRAAGFCGVCGLALGPAEPPATVVGRGPVRARAALPWSPGPAVRGGGPGGRGPGGAGSPGTAGTGRDRSARVLLAVVSAVGIVALLAGLGFYFKIFPTGSDPVAPPASVATAGPGTPASEPASPDAGPAEAAALDALLDESAGDRTAAGAAVRRIAGCDDLTGAQQDLLRVEDDRRSLASRLDGLDLSDLPDGARIGSDLREAWLASAQADHDYALWADEASAAGCPAGGPAPLTASYRDGQAVDRSATLDKTAFVGLWNPVATDHGLTQRSAEGI